MTVCVYPCVWTYINHNVSANRLLDKSHVIILPLLVECRECASIHLPLRKSQSAHTPTSRKHLITYLSNVDILRVISICFDSSVLIVYFTAPVLYHLSKFPVRNFIIRFLYEDRFTAGFVLFRGSYSVFITTLLFLRGWLVSLSLNLRLFSSGIWTQ